MFNNKIKIFNIEIDLETPLGIMAILMILLLLFCLFYIHYLSYNTIFQAIGIFVLFWIIITIFIESMEKYGFKIAFLPLLVVIGITVYGCVYFFSNVINEIAIFEGKEYSNCYSDITEMLKNKKSPEEIIERMEVVSNIPFGLLATNKGIIKNTIIKNNIQDKENLLNVLNTLNKVENNGTIVSNNWKRINNIIIISNLLSDNISKKDYLDLDNEKILEKYSFINNKIVPYYYDLYLTNGLKGTIYFTDLYLRYNDKINNKKNKDILLDEIKNKTKISKDYIENNLYSIKDKENGIGMYFLINKALEKDLKNYKYLVDKFDIKKVF